MIFSKMKIETQLKCIIWTFVENTVEDNSTCATSSMKKFTQLWNMHFKNEFHKVKINEFN